MINVSGLHVHGILVVLGWLVDEISRAVEYSASQKKFTLSKSVPREKKKLFITMGLFFQMGPNNLIIFHDWVSRSNFCEREQSPVLTGIGICFQLALYISNVETREKATQFSYSDGFMTVYERRGLLHIMNAINILCLTEQLNLLSLSLLNGVSTNLCRKNLEVRKGQWMISRKKLINQ